MNKEIRSFQGYLLTSKNLSNQTIKAYTSDLEQVEYYLSNKGKSLVNATNNDLNEYLSSLNLKEKSYNRKITSIIEFYKYLQSKDFVLKCNVNKIYHIKNDKTYPMIIKVDDIRKMIEVQPATIVGERNKVIIMLLYVSGLRVSELINLTYNDINLNEGYIRCIGKGNKEKIIYIGDLLSVTLLNYTNVIRKEILNGLYSNYLFTNSEGEPLSRQLIYKIVNNSAIDAGIKINVTPHTLRHCFATHMLENGADIRSVQEMLGHSSITTTQIYLNISNKVLKDKYFNNFKDPLKED